LKAIPLLFVSQIFDDLTRDLVDETEILVRALSQLTPLQWSVETECHPWTVKDQVIHLAWNDNAVIRAIRDPETFVRERPATLASIQHMVDAAITDNQHRTGPEVLAWFEHERAEMIRISRSLDPRLRMPWYGPDMSVMSKITARFMETWAHSDDVLSALRVEHPATDRIRHVIFLGLQALPNAFKTHGLDVPKDSIRVEVIAPSGDVWHFGPSDAPERITGPAIDLAYVVTQRRHLGDTTLTASGPIGNQWLKIAQAFAGPPGKGREHSSGEPT
jgi:uncharacterized protein (TIGR03084 family)